jgi:predicted MFS family arabinose efflux permease
MRRDSGAQSLMTPARTALFAVAGGVAVGGLYLAQPLIEIIAAGFGVTASSAAALVTVTQVGYALGIFLLVPLGDVLNRRRLIPAVLALSALALLVSALAPSYSALLAALGGVGVSSVAAQLLTPLASELAAPQERGRIVGAVAAGAMIGILLSRTVSGLVADLLGWRSVYVIMAVVAVALAIVLSRAIPLLEPRPRVPYLRLLGSVFTSAARHPAAPVTLLVSAVNFAVFSLFWTALTFLLTAEPFGYSTTQIGLVGLAGLAGALAARRAGVMHDKGWSVGTTGAALGLLALSLLGAWLTQSTIVGLVVVIVVLDVAVQASNVLNQTRLVSLAPAERSRLNTAVVVCNFFGGAVGSVLAGPLWAAGGWAAVVGGALVLTVAALLVWAVSRKRLADLS